jgi:two-component system, NtrC family, response regulator AlgB
MKILIIDDDKSIRHSTAMAIQAEGHDAATADCSAVALLKLREDQYDLAFLDLRLGDEDGLAVLEQIGQAFPALPVVLFTAYATVETAVSAIQKGAFDYLEKPFTPDQLRRLVSRVDQTHRLQRRITELESEMAAKSPDCDFDSEDPGIREAYNVLFRAAGTAASILLLGESGTGKSALAREIHLRSPLQSRPFVTVSCPSLSRELLESELFGHVRGAFTGAVKETWGKVAAAHGGTLFLDEIGELPLEIQPKLLRLLQEKQYERVGENRTRAADVRIIAATNRDLHTAVRAGRFREDLFYRLNVIAAEVPALRRRPQDVPRLARKFLTFFATQLSRPVQGFTVEAMNCLQRHAWPGNIRELRNVVERALILCQGSRIDLDDLPDTLRHAAPAEVKPGAMVTLEELERQHIVKVLETAESMEAASLTLGIDPATLYRKRKRMQLP